MRDYLAHTRFLALEDRSKGQVGAGTTVRFPIAEYWQVALYHQPIDLSLFLALLQSLTCQFMIQNLKWSKPGLCFFTRGFQARLINTWRSPRLHPEPEAHPGVDPSDKPASTNTDYLPISLPEIPAPDLDL